jgi:sodium borate transporter 11
MVQLGVLCAFGFNPWPYAKMIFPLVILSFLPIRHLVIPLFVEKKYLEVLDGNAAH